MRMNINIPVDKIQYIPDLIKVIQNQSQIISRLRSKNIFFTHFLCLKLNYFKMKFIYNYYFRTRQLAL